MSAIPFLFFKGGIFLHGWRVTSKALEKNLWAICKDSISVALRKLLQEGGRKNWATYKFITKTAGNMNIKIRYQVKEFSILCVGRCKPLGSLKSFLSFASQLSGAKSLSLFTLRSGRWLLLAFPQSSSAVIMVSGRICWISVLGALIHIWRPEITDSCDISSLLTCLEIFSFYIIIIDFLVNSYKVNRSSLQWFVSLKLCIYLYSPYHMCESPLPFKIVGNIFFLLWYSALGKADIVSPPNCF